MTTYSLSLNEAVFLEAALENPKIKEMYDGLVAELVKNTATSEDEAKQIIFPEFLEAIKSLANK